MPKVCQRAHRQAWCTAAVIAVASLSVLPCGAAEPVLPAKLAVTSAIGTLTASELEALEAGRPVARLLTADSGDEVVFGAVWIEATVADYLRAMRDIERFECGGSFTTTRRLSDPPRVEDFADMSLTDVDVADLRSCRTGKCNVILTNTSLEKFQRDIDWSSATAAESVERMARQMAFSIVEAYTASGSAGLGPYVDEARPVVPIQDLSAVLERMPMLSRSEPDFRRLLIGYPNVQLPNSTSFFYWQIVHFGLKPTIRINHVVITSAPDHFVVASKQLYASHYFRAAVEIRHLIPDPARGRGFWLLDVSAARVEGLNGLVGSLIRGHVHSETLKGLADGLEATKLKIERPQINGCSSSRTPH
jgi:hypothetical protein